MKNGQNLRRKAIVRILVPPNNDSILSDHTRFTHTSGLHYDQVNPVLLGMKKIVSEDAIRRALLHNGRVEKCGIMKGKMRDE